MLDEVGKPLAKDVNLAELACLTEGKVGSDIEGYCRKATLAAIREYLEKGKTADGPLISGRHFRQVLSEPGKVDGDGSHARKNRA